MSPEGSASAPRNQQGIALVVVLIILVLVTLLGLASMRGTLLQERMSGNQYDRNLAFQAAEVGLRAGEATLSTAACNRTTAPLCVPIGTGDGAWLQDDTWTSDAMSTAVAAANLPSGAPPTRYMRERLSPDGSSPAVYRVTARSASEGRSEVILQSIYRGL